jgi:biopolymer transport protein ExbB
LFTHAILAGRVKSILHILDEQSAGIIAEHAEKEKA